MSDTALPNRLQVPATVLRDTFAEFRRCGAGRRECQVLWTGPWTTPSVITHAVHPLHRAHAGGFDVDSGWLTEFWNWLTQTRCGIRAQVHTHPGAAFHSRTDDTWPVIHSPGFLSLVIPNFASGPIGFSDAYLAELLESGKWREVPVSDYIEVTS